MVLFYMGIVMKNKEIEFPIKKKNFYYFKMIDELFE
ncbi:hypothetical protein BOM_1252 (plasmid) [Borrelia miyamotoi FR64b]|uniref:Uncharacterized protein n=1 Tax=Borrelia miyamotoi FR64b TaxID=1292392 RepID=W5SFZ0_9SPIR|nr:hypothetical protein BOM_1252 [Borrelia miyamotoi FR64b]